MTASLVLQSALEPLPGFASSSLALYVPVVLRDGASGLTNTATVTVTVCPCLRGSMRTEERGRPQERRWERHAVCLPAPSASTSLIFSLVTLLAMLACVTTLLGKYLPTVASRAGRVASNIDTVNIKVIKVYEKFSSKCAANVIFLPFFLCLFLSVCLQYLHVPESRFSCLL